MKHSLSSLWFNTRVFCAFIGLAILALLVAWQDVTTRNEEEIDC